MHHLIMDIILKYFKELSPKQIAQFKQLLHLYTEWNSKINVISRKDMENFYERHVLHSLSIADFFDLSHHQIIDIGTGGGFPSIPLAIFFPESQFHLVDSIGKKISVVNAIAEALELKNITAQHGRAEQCTNLFDYAVTRAVAPAADLIHWTSKNVNKKNGIIALKGGDLREELKAVNCKKEIYHLSAVYSEPFFETKKIIHLHQIK